LAVFSTTGDILVADLPALTEAVTAFEAAMTR
jgi:hypothetical protein